MKLCIRKLYQKLIPSSVSGSYNKKMTKHLAILQQPYLDLILYGKKTIESRFSKNKSLPFNKITPGDVVLLKESGGEVLGEFLVEQVSYFESLNPISSNALLQKYQEQLCIDDTFISRKINSKYATLITIKSYLRYAKSYPFPKRDMRSWVIL
jgi:ASC-1-like (ASCH) protein